MELANILGLNPRIAGVKRISVVKYAGDDKLYVPAERQSLQKYIGTDDDVPKLYKLGSSDWVKVNESKSVQSSEDLEAVC